jgi:hypothetical protein
LKSPKKTLNETRQTQNKSDDEEAKLRVDIDELNSEVNTKDTTIERLRNRIAALRRAEHGDAACENCKTLQEELTRLKDWQRSQKASFRLDRKKCADMEDELKKAKRVQQLMSLDATIKAVQQELPADKAKTDEIKQAGNDPTTSPAEIEQLKSWLEETRVALCWMLGVSSGEPRVPSTEGSKPNELAQLLREVKEKCERAEVWQNTVYDLQKELKESNLADLREEIQTLKECLATSQADLFAAHAPAGPLKADNKIKQIIDLKKQVTNLQSQLSKPQGPAPATEDPAWKAKFDASELRLAELTAKIAGLEAQLTQALSSALSAMQTLRKQSMTYSSN